MTRKPSVPLDPLVTNRTRRLILQSALMSGALAATGASAGTRATGSPPSIE